MKKGLFLGKKKKNALLKKETINRAYRFWFSYSSPNLVARSAFARFHDMLRTDRPDVRSNAYVSSHLYHLQISSIFRQESVNQIVCKAVIWIYTALKCRRHPAIDLSICPNIETWFVCAKHMYGVILNFGSREAEHLSSFQIICKISYHLILQIISK